MTKSNYMYFGNTQTSQTCPTIHGVQSSVVTLDVYKVYNILGMIGPSFDYVEKYGVDANPMF